MRGKILSLVLKISLVITFLVAIGISLIEALFILVLGIFLSHILSNSFSSSGLFDSGTSFILTSNISLPYGGLIAVALPVLGMLICLC